MYPMYQSCGICFTMQEHSAKTFDFGCSSLAKCPPSSSYMPWNSTLTSKHEIQRKILSTAQQKCTTRFAIGGIFSVPLVRGGMVDYNGFVTMTKLPLRWWICTSRGWVLLVVVNVGYSTWSHHDNPTSKMKMGFKTWYERGTMHPTTSIHTMASSFVYFCGLWIDLCFKDMLGGYFFHSFPRTKRVDTNVELTLSRFICVALARCYLYSTLPSSAFFCLVQLGHQLTVIISRCMPTGTCEPVRRRIR